MLKKLTGKLKIGKSDKALISKLERIKEARATSPQKAPPKNSQDGRDELLDNDFLLEESGESTEGFTEEVPEELKTIEDKISEKVEQLLAEKTKNLTEAIESIKELDNRVTKMDVAVSSAKQTVDMFKDRLDKIDETMLELLSLYEVVSNTVNPFVGDGDGSGASLERFEAIEKQISELAQNLSLLQAEVATLQTTIENPQFKLPEDFENQINERFAALENTIHSFQELIETQSQGTPDLEELVEKVSQQVIEKLSESRDQSNTNSPCTEEQAQQTKQKQYRLAHLENRPETYIILLNWIEFLMEKVGRNNLVDVLNYYVEIGWISEEVSAKMLAYADGIDYYVEKPTWKLLPEDHTKSLMFIEQLRGNKIDKSIFIKLEREIDKVKHSMETLYGV